MRFFRVFQRLLRNHGWAHALRYLVNYIALRRHAKWPVYGNREMRYLSQVLRGGQWGGVPVPNKFAAEFTKQFTGRRAEGRRRNHRACLDLRCDRLGRA